MFALKNISYTQKHGNIQSFLYIERSYIFHAIKILTQIQIKNYIGCEIHVQVKLPASSGFVAEQSASFPGREDDLKTLFCLTNSRALFAARAAYIRHNRYNW